MQRGRNRGWKWISFTQLPVAISFTFQYDFLKATSIIAILFLHCAALWFRILQLPADIGGSHIAVSLSSEAAKNVSFSKTTVDQPAIRGFPLLLYIRVSPLISRNTAWCSLWVYSHWPQHPFRERDTEVSQIDDQASKGGYSSNVGWCNVHLHKDFK